LKTTEYRLYYADSPNSERRANMAWIFNKEGFFSAVQNQYCTDKEVMVRARLREDIERLAEATGSPVSDVMATPDADYAFRLKLSKQAWADYMHRSALDIDYPNFKNAALSLGEDERSRAYHDVWSAMYRLQMK
jgi:hypothetical protein